MPDRTFNLTPDPKVLIALTRTPLKPLDALCELIDNALDGFRLAEAQDQKVEHPYVTIDIPGPAEVDNGTGVLRIRDNGPGMAPAVAEKALRAGYSGNNPFDSLGLFGMGFNISTGKLGRRTVFRTVRETDAKQLEVRIDLEEIQRLGTYDVPVDFTPRAEAFPHGTVVEISEWWPRGDMNHNFAKNLAQQRKRLRELIGRRYATILRERNVRITINGTPCEPFEHCVWAEHRYVERTGHGQIPARFDFDDSVGAQRRCSACFTLIEQDEAQCSACASQSFRTVEQRIRGWVGIQRFDEETNFGIDLIRNGRTIRVAEKSAFFEYADELGSLTKDYPIDQQYGRVVGEVHLDHVPVDFQKQDFQRSTPEWEQAMVFLRGASSLQPNKPGADQNTSPVFKLYQGYRKVRNVGRRDMYMGQWEAGAEKARRVSRDVEQEYYARFRAKEQGYYDDAEWWRLVEAADTRPMEELVQCPMCHVDNLKSIEICEGCGYALIGHDCANCGERIPSSARSCPHCGQDQIPEDTTPWPCAVCGNQNPYDVDACGQCEYPRGTPPLASREYLEGRSQLDPNLCIAGCTVTLADGSSSQPLNVKVQRTNEHITPTWGGAPLPLVAVREAELTVFLDPRHEVFSSFDVRPETLIAAEVAHYVYMLNQRLAASSHGQHSVSVIASSIMSTYYRDQLDLSPESLREAIGETISALRRRLAEGLMHGDAENLFNDFEETDQKAFAENLVGSGRPLTEVESVITSGEFIDFLHPASLVPLFEMRPQSVLPHLAVSSSGPIAVEVAEGLAKQQVRELSRALEDCVSYTIAVNPSEALTRKVKASLEFLRSKLDL